MNFSKNSYQKWKSASYAKYKTFQGEHISLVKLGCWLKKLTPEMCKAKHSSIKVNIVYGLNYGLDLRMKKICIFPTSKQFFSWTIITSLCANTVLCNWDSARLSVWSEIELLSYLNNYFRLHVYLSFCP